jgi:hypothetical protein
MVQQDRKRAFSKAFQPMCEDPFRKALRSVVASSAASTPQIFRSPTASFDLDKDNVALFANGTEAQVEIPKAVKPPFTPHVDQAQERLPLSTQLFHDLPEIQYTDSSIGGQGCATPQNQPLFDLTSSSSEFIPELNAISSQVPAHYSDVAIFEDGDTAMYAGFNKAGPVTPSALDFEELSLQDIPKRPLPVLPLMGVQRASVFTMESSIFDGYVVPLDTEQELLNLIQLHPYYSAQRSHHLLQ